MEMANIGEAKAHLSELIKKALAGEEIIISRANEPLVRLMPVYQDMRPRQGGFLSGQIVYEENPAAADKEIENLMLGS